MEPSGASENTSWEQNLAIARSAARRAILGGMGQQKTTAEPRTPSVQKLFGNI